MSETVMIVLQLLFGLVLLSGGGDMLVRGSVRVATRMGVSPMMIGLTLVGFGTSTPELVTSVKAALGGYPDIAVGNVVGSNICNILLILGIAALIYPITCQPNAIKRDGMWMIGVSIVFLLLFVFVGHMPRWLGVASVLGLIGYIYSTYRQEKQSPQSDSADLHARETHLAEPNPKDLVVAIAIAVAGIALTVLGAKFLVESAVKLATNFGISQSVIGLTIVAIGTSLPELVTSVIAAIRRESDIALGNVLGSNIYNLLGILGITAIIKPITIPAVMIRWDVWVMTAVAILLVVKMRQGYRLSRVNGVILLALYGAYVYSMTLYPQGVANIPSLLGL